MPSISTYNDSSIPDDGSKTAANQVKYATIKTDLTDPLKDWIEANGFELGADIASATALDVNIPGNVHDVTGTTTITSFAAITGSNPVVKTLQFDGALTLTHHATNLILPGGANITTAAGDIGIFYEYGAGTWRCIAYVGNNAQVNNLDVKGAFTSIGIDDNATSVAITINSSEDVFVGKTSSSLPSTGCEVRGSVGQINSTAPTDPPFQANRSSDDGDVYAVYAQDVLEGAVQVSGTTVSIRGAHLNFLTQLGLAHPTRRDDTIKRGTVMEYVDELCEWFFEDWEEICDELDKKGKPTGNKIKVKKRLAVQDINGTGKGIVTKRTKHTVRCLPSTTKGSKAVAGVFEQWYDDNPYDNSPEDNNTWDYDFTCATTGDFHIRVTGPCKMGDLLESNGDGTAVVQADDIIRSSTIAKAVQSFPNIPVGQENPKLVPCQLLNG